VTDGLDRTLGIGLSGSEATMGNTLYRTQFPSPDDGTGGLEVEEGYAAWLTIKELVKDGWLVEVKEEWEQLARSYAETLGIGGSDDG
jgi:hypothetical protein